MAEAFDIFDEGNKEEERIEMRDRRTEQEYRDQSFLDDNYHIIGDRDYNNPIIGDTDETSFIEGNENSFDYNDRDLQEISRDIKEYPRDTLRNMQVDIGRKLSEIQNERKYGTISSREEALEENLVDLVDEISNEIFRRDEIQTNLGLNDYDYERLLNRSFELEDEIDEINTSDNEYTKKEEELRTVEDVLERKKYESDVLDD